MAIDLFTLIFEEFLKISPSLLSKYSLIQDQLLYLILIPHVVLLLFLFGFGMTIIANHKGLRYLLTISAYVFIIWGGWYGTILVPLTIGWFYLLLVMGFIFFFVGRIIHPSRATELFNVSKSISEKLTEKSKKRKEYEKEIRNLDAQITSLRVSLGQPNVDRRYIQTQIAGLRAQKSAIENMLRDL